MTSYFVLLNALLLGRLALYFFDEPVSGRRVWIVGGLLIGFSWLCFQPSWQLVGLSVALMLSFFLTRAGEQKFAPAAVRLGTLLLMVLVLGSFVLHRWGWSFGNNGSQLASGYPAMCCPWHGYRVSPNSRSKSILPVC
jgi:hypothetical protein